MKSNEEITDGAVRFTYLLFGVMFAWYAWPILHLNKLLGIIFIALTLASLLNILKPRMNGLLWWQTLQIVKMTGGGLMLLLWAQSIMLFPPALAMVGIGIAPTINQVAFTTPHPNFFVGMATGFWESLYFISYPVRSDFEFVNLSTGQSYRDEPQIAYTLNTGTVANYNTQARTLAGPYWLNIVGNSQKSAHVYGTSVWQYNGTLVIAITQTQSVSLEPAADGSMFAIVFDSGKVTGTFTVQPEQGLIVGLSGYSIGVGFDRVTKEFIIGY